MNNIGIDIYNKKILILCGISILISVTPIILMSFVFISETSSFDDNLEWTISAFLIGGDKPVDSVPLFALVILYLFGIIFISIIITIIITFVERHLYVNVLKIGIKEIAKEVVEEERKKRGD